MDKILFSCDSLVRTSRVNVGKVLDAWKVTLGFPDLSHICTLAAPAMEGERKLLVIKWEPFASM